MRSFSEIEADIRGLAAEMLEKTLYYEGLLDHIDFENDEDEEAADAYDEIVTAADTVTEQLTDALEEIRVCVLAVKDLAELKKPV